MSRPGARWLEPPRGGILLSMVGQPTGTVTMLFSDIEESTRLLARLGTGSYAQALELHRQLMRDAFERHDGYEVDYEGDGFFTTFSRAEDAVAAAAEAQRGLADAEWPPGGAIRVRMGIHTGEPLAVPPKYVGLDVHRAARIMAAGHGGQVLLSEATRRLVPDADTIPLGSHRLKDLLQPEPLHQLRIAAVPSEFPSLKTLDAKPTNLPVIRDATIGREHELAEIAALLRDNGSRLLTLTGPGGTGKTRLALQAAAEVVEDFADGVFAVALAAITDGRRVLSAVAQALELRERAGEPLADTLASYLEERRLLLVLDNFEQVLEAAAEMSGLLARCPHLQLLVTSRERLRIAGERVFPVSPLRLPRPDDGAAVLAGNEAVSLFVERARAASGEFAPTEHELSTIAEICRRLDGLPLAIELAAARVPVLPPAALLRRLDRRLHVLTRGGRDADARQQTLRATIDWSHSLLDAEERRVFAHLAVFVDGCRLGSAAAVAETGEDAMLDVLSSLVEKNLLRRHTDPDGEPRFSMLETIREYAGEQLDTRGEAAEARERHLLEMVGSVRAISSTPGLDVIALFEAELGNLRAALRTAIGTGRATEALVMTGAARTFWIVHLVEGSEWLAAALALPEPSDPAARAAALEVAAFLALIRGNASEAASFADEALRVARELGDLKGVANAERQLANALIVSERIEEALVMYETSLETARRSRDELAIAHAMHGLGNAALHVGDDERAVEISTQALELYIRLGEDFAAVRARFNLGLAALGQRRYDDAWELFVASLRPAVAMQQAGSKGAWLDGIAFPLSAMAIALAETGEHRHSAKLLGTADALLAEAGAARVGPELRLHTKTVAALKAALGDAAFTDVYDEGRRTRWEDAVAWVLGRPAVAHLSAR